MTAPSVTATTTADLLMDPGWLSGRVGAPIRATRLRHKPGLSTTAALLADGGAEDGRPVGWVQALLPGHRDKIANAVRRAARRGLTVSVLEPDGPGGIRLAFGELDTDPRLGRALRALAESDPAVLVDGRVGPVLRRGTLDVLRYNPLRRMVLRSNPGGIGIGIDAAPEVFRLTARPAAVQVRALHELSAQGVPVLLPSAVGSCGRLSRWPWAGDVDLSGAIDAPARARDTGAALAALHAATVTDVLLPVRRDDSGVQRALLRLASDVGHLDPVLGDRTRDLVYRASTGSSRGDVVLHGDFSADQVVLDGGSLRLLDFDRMSRGVPAEDLGCFLATQWLADSVAADTVTGALLEGYREAGGRPGDAAALRRATATALLRRVLDAFRDARPDWRHAVACRLDAIDDVLDGAPLAGLSPVGGRT